MSASQNYNKGFLQGKEQGRNEGLNEGKRAGYLEGVSEGEERGFKAGYDEGFESAYRVMLPVGFNGQQNGFVALSFRSVLRLCSLGFEAARMAVCEALRCYGGQLLAIVSDEQLLSLAHSADPMERAFRVAESIEPRKKKPIGEALFNAYQAVLCSVQWWRTGHAVWGDIPESARARYRPPATRGESSVLAPAGGSAGAPVGWAEVRPEGPEQSGRKGARGQ